MHLSSALLTTAVALLASANIGSAAKNQVDTLLVAHPPSYHQESDYTKTLLRTTAQTYDLGDGAEDRMFSPMINGVLGKVGSVVETGGAKVVQEVPKLEKYQKWLKAGLSPSQVRVDVLKKEPWQALSSILRGKDSNQYLKFIVDFKRSQPGSKIPKSASEMQNYELWLYAGLTPSQVRVDILKKEPWLALRSILKSKDSNQYLKFIVDYKRSQPGSKIRNSAAQMQKYELWFHAGLTPFQVRADILKTTPWGVHKHKDWRQYAKFMVVYM